jgi:hypothetical protein
LNAILNRKRTFLEQRIWKEVPWENSASSKTQLDYLIDILCDFPGLLEDADDAELVGALPEDNRTSWINIQHLCQEKLTKLSEWRRGWESTFGQCRYEVDISQSSDSSAEPSSPLFPSVFNFTGIWRAYEFCVHNALRILLLRLSSRACIMAHGGTASPRQTMATGSVENEAGVEELAIEICRSIDYFLKEHGQIGAVLLMFPAQIALLPLICKSEAGTWLKNVLEKIAESGGLEISRQILLGRCTDLARTCR